MEPLEQGPATAHRPGFDAVAPARRRKPRHRGEALPYDGARVGAALNRLVGDLDSLPGAIPACWRPARPRIDEVASLSAAAIRTAARHDRLRWYPVHDAEVRDHYWRWGRIPDVAALMRLDADETAARLIELLLRPEGDVRTEPLRRRSDDLLTRSEQATAVMQWELGASLPAIAGAAGRTQFAVGWSILESVERPVGLPVR